MILAPDIKYQDLLIYLLWSQIVEKDAKHIVEGMVHNKSIREQANQEKMELSVQDMDWL